MWVGKHRCKSCLLQQTVSHVFPSKIDTTIPNISIGRLSLKCDGTRAETAFRLSAKRTSPFKSARASVQSTTGSRGVRISGSNVGYTMFRGSVKSTAYPLHSPVSPSLPHPASPCTIVFQLNSTHHLRLLLPPYEYVQYFSANSPDWFRPQLLFVMTEVKVHSWIDQ